MNEQVFERIRRHTAEVEGTLESVFEGIEIPPLPTVATHLIEEINRPEPDMGRLIAVISSAPETAAKVIRTVNSSIFSLRNPVLSVRHAIALLGLRHIRPIALSYALADGIPHPPADIFDHEAFWSDSLIRAMLARSFARLHCQGEEEEAFTAMLVSDLAVPVLLVAWRDSYEPIIAEWRGGTRRLSTLEQVRFGWQHAQAGAWILRSWGLPPALHCYVGLHNAGPAQVEELELGHTILLPLGVAAMAPSVMRDDDARGEHFARTAMKVFSLKPSEIVHLIAGIRASFGEICELFDLTEAPAANMLDRLIASASLLENGGHPTS